MVRQGGRLCLPEVSGLVPCPLVPHRLAAVGVSTDWGVGHTRGHHPTLGLPAVTIPSGGSRSPATGTSSAGGRYDCKNLSWQEAQQLLRQGHSYLDRDGDGEACEGRG
jgi:hypothetical protein